MLKYRLQFAAASGSRSTDRYGEIYKALREQLQELNIDDAALAGGMALDKIDLINGFKDWKFTGDARAILTYRNKPKALIHLEKRNARTPPARHP